MRPLIFWLYEFSVLRYRRENLQYGEQEPMSFARAQTRWEQSWIDGPPDDPADDPQAMEYIDRLARMSDEDLYQELANVRADLRSPSRCSKMDNLRASKVWIEEEIRVRNEGTVDA